MMNKRKQRLLLIGQLIESESIASQDDLRTDGAKRVEGLRARPLTAALLVALPATRRNIIADTITMHVAQCLFF